jgi:hypothetical protein
MEPEREKIKTVIGNITKTNLEDTRQEDLDKIDGVIHQKVKSRNDAEMFIEVHDAIESFHPFIKRAIYAKVPKSKIEKIYRYSQKLIINGDVHVTYHSGDDRGGNKPPNDTPTSTDSPHNENFREKIWDFIKAIIAFIISIIIGK